MNKQYRTVKLYITPTYENSRLSCSVSGPDWVYLHDNILYFYPDREVTQGTYSVTVSVAEIPIASTSSIPSGHVEPDFTDLSITCSVIFNTATNPR